MPDSKEAQQALAKVAAITDLITELGDHPNTRAHRAFEAEVISIITGDPVVTREDPPVEEAAPVETIGEIELEAEGEVIAAEQAAAEAPPVAKG